MNRWYLKIVILLVAVAASSWLITSTSAQDTEATKKDPAAMAELAAKGAELFKSRTCFTCHGEDGKTTILPQYPKIAGQNPEYALQQMIDIKSGVRTNGMSAAMKGIMHLVSDEEMKILAEYVATMEP
jgi:cytochrome c